MPGGAEGGGDRAAPNTSPASLDQTSLIVSRFMGAIVGILYFL